MRKCFCFSSDNQSTRQPKQLQVRGVYTIFWLPEWRTKEVLHTTNISTLINAHTLNLRNCLLYHQQYNNFLTLTTKWVLNFLLGDNAHTPCMHVYPNMLRQAIHVTSPKGVKVKQLNILKYDITVVLITSHKLPSHPIRVHNVTM